MTYVLHYAPDNASLIIRLALEHVGAPYRTCLVDRAVSAQRSAAYLALNPNGLIPALETDDGVMFETTAILLYLAERHAGLLPQNPSERAMALKWLVWIGNTLHPGARMLFYPQTFVVGDPENLRLTTRERLTKMLQILEAAEDTPWLDGRGSAPGFYLAALLRWFQIYGGPAWFALSDHPRLATFAAAIDQLPATKAACAAEGMAPAPFSRAARPHPPEGSAL